MALFGRRDLRSVISGKKKGSSSSINLDRLEFRDYFSGAKHEYIKPRCFNSVVAFSELLNKQNCFLVGLLEETIEMKNYTLSYF